MSSRKFYRQVITIEVLSEEPHNWANLNAVVYHITEGECSGTTNFGPWETLEGKQTADALVKQGSDPEFFNLTSAGEDIE